ncbi:hypothetical protein ROD_12631 [Citrobacter rodentium ICC168]|uniref:Uncharacterized protein n=1 Tax=Citrobacter rodentium (strain ICC168) TaxID=637910 RepID=D2TUH3_CITRI|nr:hypothetical protein ROD_12631 [Citrobacter rodentium ICC168]
MMMSLAKRKTERYHYNTSQGVNSKLKDCDSSKRSVV